MTLRALSLFSGIGGFDLAAQRCGIEVITHSEIDQQACKLLAARFPDARQLGDISQVSEEVLRGLGPIDLVFGGWPCQDLSVAGRRAGLAGARSGLWSEVVRVLATTRPRWFVGENVPGLLSSNAGRDMATVVTDLAELGFLGAYRVLDARYFGVAQRRRRVLIVGCLGDSASAAKVLLEPEGGEWHPAASSAARAAVAGTLGGGSGERGTDDPDRVTFVPEVADPLRSAAGGASHNKANGTDRATMVVTHTLRGEGMDAGEDGNMSGKQYEGVMAQSAVRRLLPVECERLQGFPDGWTEGFADSTRYRMLGNAICVNVAEWVLRRVATSA